MGAVSVRARTVLDRVDHEGECVVLVGDQVVRLSALATALLDACPDWREVDWLADRLDQEFGPPPDGDSRAATRILLAELAGLGLVESR